MKSRRHLFHDRASKGHGSIPGLMSHIHDFVTICIVACKEVCDVKPAIDLCPYYLGRGNDNGLIS